MRFLSAQPPREGVSVELQQYLGNVYKEIQSLQVNQLKVDFVTLNIDSRGTTVAVQNPVGAILLNPESTGLTVAMTSDKLTFQGVTQRAANILIYRR